MPEILKNGKVILGNVPTDELMERLEAHRKNDPNNSYTINFNK